LLHVSVTSNHHQADISVLGHDIFSATVWDPVLFTFAVCFDGIGSSYKEVRPRYAILIHTCFISKELT